MKSTVPKNVILLSFAGVLLLIGVGGLIMPAWVGNYRRLSAVRKTSPNYLKPVGSSDRTVVFETNVDMTPDKLYFHNSYPCLVICLNKKKYTRDNIANLEIEVESVEKTVTSHKKGFKSADFKYVTQNQKSLIKSIGKDSEDFICFYPVGMLKLSPGLNKFTVLIKGLSFTSPNDIRILLHFHETSNTMILLEPLKYLHLPGSSTSK